MTTTNFQRLIGLLSEAEVEFVVIGGLAAIVHGSAHVTYDVDVCYHRSPANVERLCRALVVIRPTLRGAPRDIPFRFDPPTVLAGLNFTLDTDIGALDLLGEVLPLGEFPQVAEHSEEAELFGHRVRVLSLEGLIRAKRAAGRNKDLLVVPELEALLEMKKRPPP
ncbi:MAG: nucleotidyltransferase [Chloroflexi bacterium]|nr:nucleotidyltransferase [Chloroflexota bacterium]